MKKVFLILSLLLITQGLMAAARFKAGTLPLVDGVYNSTQAVITGRNPMFIWEYSCVISSFSLIVSSDPVTFNSSGELWNYVGSTTTTNTINFITRIPYSTDGAGAALSAGNVYYWQVTIYESSITEGVTSAAASGEFTAVQAASSIDRERFDLSVDLNNPFNPAIGQSTVFRYGSRDRDRRVKLRVFSMSGDLVQEWPEQTVFKDAWHSQVWDGRNYNGEIIGRGMYFVNLVDVGDFQGITRRVVVVK